MYFHSLSVIMNLIVIASSIFILEPILDYCPVEKDPSQEEFELDSSQDGLSKVSSPILVSSL